MLPKMPGVNSLKCRKYLKLIHVDLRCERVGIVFDSWRSIRKGSRCRSLFLSCSEFSELSPSQAPGAGSRRAWRDSWAGGSRGPAAWLRHGRPPLLFLSFSPFDSHFSLGVRTFLHSYFFADSTPFRSPALRWYIRTHWHCALASRPAPFAVAFPHDGRAPFSPDCPPHWITPPFFAQEKADGVICRRHWRRMSGSTRFFAILFLHAGWLNAALFYSASVLFCPAGKRTTPRASSSRLASRSSTSTS